MNLYTWLSPNDCDPPHGLNLSPGSRDSEKVQGLADAFVDKDGFDEDYPALVGYPLDGRIQLVSGTHRHEAAKRTGFYLPVTLFLRSYIEAYWGTKRWLNVLEDIPVKELRVSSQAPDVPPGLSERYSP